MQLPQPMQFLELLGSFFICCVFWCFWHFWAPLGTFQLFLHFLALEKRREKYLKKSCVTCHMTGVKSHMKPGTFHMSHVTCHMSLTATPTDFVPCKLSHYPQQAGSRSKNPKQVEKIKNSLKRNKRKLCDCRPLLAIRSPEHREVSFLRLHKHTDEHYDRGLNWPQGRFS